MKGKIPIKIQSQSRYYQEGFSVSRLYMLHLILSRVGGGKTTHVRKLVADYAQAGVRGMTVIVPEQFSFATERAMLELLGARDADKAEVFSFSRLAERILEQQGLSSKEKVDDSSRFILMSLALDSLKDSLEIYSKHSSSSAVTAELLSLSSELKQCCVNPEELRNAVSDMKDYLLKKKTLEISLILETYEAMLAQSFSDEKDNLTKLYELLLDVEYFKGQIVVIDAFKGFTEQEYKVIERILVQAKVVYITLCTDVLYPTEDKNGIFTFVRKTAQRLISIAKNHNVKVAIPSRLSGESKFNNFPPRFNRYKSDALNALERGIYDPCAPIYDKTTDDITVCEALNRYDECAFVAQSIKRLMREGYRCREIAVISREEGSYDTSLFSALRKCNIPVFEDKRHAINTQPLIVMVDCLLRIVSEGFKTEYISRYLKTELSPLSCDEAAELESYVLLWDIKGSMWLKEWNMHPQGYGVEFMPDDFEYLERINDLRLRVIKPITHLKNNFGQSDSQNAESVYLFLDKNDIRSKLKDFVVCLHENGEPDLACEQERIWEILMNVLDKLHLLLNKKTVSAKQFCDYFELAVSAQTLGNIPQGLDEITVGSAERVRPSSPKAVFIIGANEGVFPRSPITTGLITDEERNRLRAQGIRFPEVGEAKTLHERFIVYNSVCSAKEKLFVSYSATDNSGASLAPSEIVTQIKTLFPNSTFLSTKDIPYEERIEGDLPTFELLCSSDRDSVLYASLKEYFSKREDFTDKVSSLERIVSNEPFAIRDGETAKNLFGKNLYLSASRVETYHKCPFKYFCEYGLRAKKSAPASFDPMLRGTVIHYVLENFLKAHSGDDLSILSKDEIREEITELLDKYMQERMGADEKPKRFEYLYSKLKYNLTEIIEILACEFSVSEFRPVDFELTIDNDGEIKPYTVNLPDGGTLKIKGQIDRVDAFELDGKTYIRIVDYKSGGKKFELGEVLNGLNMQMLIYLFTIWKNGSERYGDVIPSGILYKAAKIKTQKAQRGDSEENLQKEKVKSSRMDGMVLDNSIVISAMDENISGLYVPVTADKSGNFKGSLINMKQLAMLQKKTDNILSEMAKSLHSGRIEALPSKKDKTSIACDFCDYNVICGHESDSECRELNVPGHNDALKIIEEEAE